jgi:predicted  nucleic acid-binding Zn-ribbon protein
MLPVVADLLQLQERDQRLRALIKDYKDVPVLQQRAKLQLADDTAATSAALLGMREVEVKIKSIELDIQTRQNSIKRLQDQQFETRKNDEFQAMGNEVIRYQKEINTLEDRIIEHMEQLEAAKEIHRLASEKLAATTSRVNEEIVQLEERGKNLEVRIADLKAERAGLTTGLDAASMGMYDRLMKSKGNAAIVVVESGNCGGCHMKLVTSTLTELRANDKIIHCEQCGRILYFA